MSNGSITDAAIHSASELGIQVALEVSSSLTSHPTGVQRYIDGVLAGLRQAGSVRVARLLKLSRWKKRTLVPRAPEPSRWYGPLPSGAFRDLDLIHCLDPTLPWSTHRKPLVVTIHDLYLARHAKEVDPQVREKKLNRVLRVCRIANEIVVPTEAIKKELHELADVNAAVSAVAHGISPRFFSDAFSSSTPLPQVPYALGFCGGVRKNLSRFSAAFLESRLFQAGWHLVVIGKPGPSELKDLPKALPAERLHFLGAVNEKTLLAAYKRAGVVCYPSVYEGFGLPVLEAMAAGRPVVTGGAGATGEIAGDYAVKVDPLVVDDIARGLDLAVDIDDERLESARTYAASFTWDTVGKRLERIYQSAIGRSFRGAP